jgi:hypothetical protein
MNRRSFIQNTAFAFGALTLAQQNIFSAFLSKPGAVTAPFMFHMMTDKIGVFTESGGTIGFMIDKKGVVVVDAQFPTTAPHVISELQKKTDTPIKYLINTHHHGDKTEWPSMVRILTNNYCQLKHMLKNGNRTWAMRALRYITGDLHILTVIVLFILKIRTLFIWVILCSTVVIHMSTVVRVQTLRTG